MHPHPTMPYGRRHIVGALVLAAVTLLAACSGQDEATSDSAAEWDGGDAMSGDAADDGDAYESPEGAADRDASDGGTGDAGGRSEDPFLLTAAPSGRRVIRTAELVIEVADPAAAADEVAAIADRSGGFVAETDLERDREGVVRGSITLRVPSASLFEVVEELDALGTAVPVRRIDERDVTSEATDLEAQRTNLLAYERELRTLLADVRETTTRPDDLLVVFERIRSVRQEIDRIEARLAVLGDQVALSTVTVAIRPAGNALPVTDPTWQPGQTIRDALATTVRMLTGVADAAIWLGLTALPVVLVIGAPAALGLLVWRSRRRSGDSLPPPATPTAPPA